MDRLYIDKIVKQYFESENYYVKKGSSGMNNTTKFIVIDNEEFILRIYESHNDNEKVNYEHTVLKALSERSLSFNIPKPKVSLKGNTIGISSDGKLVSMAKMIKGKNPRLETVEQFYNLGSVVGEITRELGKINIKKNPIYFPCYELEKSYPKFQLNEVIEFCINPPEDFNKEKNELFDLSRYFISFKECIPDLRNLPHQLIHGDINASNVLEDENNNISAVLDFEFVSRDIRVMDLAICLSEAISNKNSDEFKFKCMKRFIEGYKKNINLTIDEVKAVPKLIMLRRLDVIVHFLVRYNEGISNSFMSAIEILREQIIKAVTLCKWVSENESKIIKLFI